uniref:Protein phosphatase 2C-like domain-containing protein 1 n=1 Tax=Phallusia mammillata TaxID=59560 RepID=A0A6F9DPD5_9ASCI|nr:protein phosphatase 2C-like domain-containing protein 1 [Phallusia mammillata]
MLQLVLILFNMEITLKCSKCKSTIPVLSLNDHHNHHSALQVLKFKNVSRGPVTTEILLKRRRLIIKKLVSRFKEKPNDPDLLRRIDKVNESFDIVRSDLLRGKSVCHCLTPLMIRSTTKEGGLRADDEELINDIKSNAVTALSTSGLPNCVTAIGACEAMNIEAKSVMEDRTMVFCGYSQKGSDDPTGKSSCFIGLYDGYCGSAAVSHSHQHFHEILREELNDRPQNHTTVDLSDPEQPSDNVRILERLNSGTGTEYTEDETQKLNRRNMKQHEDTLRAFQRAYRRMDAYLAYGIDEKSWVRWSGCSAVTCVICDEPKSHTEDGSGDAKPRGGDQESSIQGSYFGRAYFANAGDVEAYLCHKNKPFALTKRHTPHDEQECQRVEAAGGKILRSGRSLTVNSVLATSRGLGNHGDPVLRKCVINEPYTATARISEGSQFIVMATSSVWNALGVEEIFHLIKNTSLDSIGSRFPLPMTMLYKHKRQDSRDAESGEEDTGGEESVLQDPKMLASIVETDEEMCDEIEEVVIVSGHDDDDQSSMTSAGVRENSPVGSEAGDTQGTSVDTIDQAHQKERKVMLTKGKLAQAMSERIVRSALTAGATENLSAIVVLLKGFDA